MICEIGAGNGVLSNNLIKLTNIIHLVEIDERFSSKLRDRFRSIERVNVHQLDALKLNLENLSKDNKFFLVGNLPYNISSVLLIHLLSQRNRIRRMIFMVQREVAQRLVAPVGCKQYGRLSVVVQRLFDCSLLFDVGPECFNPEPKVWSSVVQFCARAEPLGPIVSDSSYEWLVRCAFAQRRKRLKNALKELCSEEIIENAGINSKSRAEDLSPIDYAILLSSIENSFN